MYAPRPGAVRDGCFQRVRYTGATVHLPIGLNVHNNGIRLTFTEPLDRELAEDLDSYSISQWNYLYSSKYGSKEYSVREPGVEGHDRVEVNSATLLADGRSDFLDVAGLGPVMQMQIRFDLEAADGAPVFGEIYNTIHRLGPALERPADRTPETLDLPL
jgi:hypothetical protein